MFSNYKSYYKEPEQRCMTDHRIKNNHQYLPRVVGPYTRSNLCQRRLLKGNLI
jgi:hypothetical protein